MGCETRCLYRNSASIYELVFQNANSGISMDWLKGAFEKVLWNSRLVVLFAVITSVLAGMVLFCVIGVESLRVLLNMLHYANPAMALDQREAILRQSILREIALIDGYLLGAFMFIFGFGLYELFLADFQEARSSQASGRILRIKSLDDLKTRLGKVILIILVVEIFKDAFGIKAENPLDLLYVAAAIALIGLALYLTRGSESERKSALTPQDESQDHH
jgi:uncharacterized membrane protein YqhA